VTKLAALVCVLAVLIISCTSKSNVVTSPTAVAGAEPTSEPELRAIAQLHFNSFQAADWGTFWDDFDSSSKAVVSRDDYIRKLTACSRYDANRGKPLTVRSVSDNHDGTWSVVVRYGNLQITFPARYESGHWRFVLDAKARSDLQKPFDAYVATVCKG